MAQGRKDETSGVTVIGHYFWAIAEGRATWASVSWKARRREARQKVLECVQKEIDDTYKREEERQIFLASYGVLKMKLE